MCVCGRNVHIRESMWMFPASVFCPQPGDLSACARTVRKSMEYLNRLRVTLTTHRKEQQMSQGSAASVLAPRMSPAASQSEAWDAGGV